MSAAGSDAVVLRLAFRPPYDWDFVRDFLSARAVPGVERVDERGYARTVALPTGAAVIRVRPRPDSHELELTVAGAPASALFQLSTTARRVFDLAADPAVTIRALGSDPLLGELVRRRPGLRIPGAWDAFECAVRAVLGQQVSVAAARTLAARLVARAGRRLDAAASTAGGAEGLTHLFPSPEALAQADLSGIGVTTARIAAIQTLARAALGGQVDFAAPTEEAVAALVALPGIGAWTAQYIAMRALGEPDALPAEDIVLRRMAAQAAVPLSARQLAQRAESWRPWRSYAVMHLWCAATDPALATRSRTMKEPTP